MKTSLKIFALVLFNFPIQAIAQDLISFSADVKTRRGGPIQFFTNPCNNNPQDILETDKLFSLYSSSRLIGGNLLCGEIEAEMKTSYSPGYCQKVLACADLKNSTKEFNANGGTKLLRETIAREYLASEMKLNIVGMEKFESMAKFAQKKFGNKFVNFCTPKFRDDLNDSICTSRIHNAFLDSQKNCNLAMLGCYSNERLGLPAYATMASTFSVQENAFSKYFTKVTDRIVKNAEEEERESTLTLMNTLTTDEPLQVKVDKFYSTILRLERENKVDPILSYYPNQESLNRPVEIKKRYENFLKENINEKTSALSLIKKFDEFKLQLANDLNQENCLQTSDYESLCEGSENILSGKMKVEVSLNVARDRLKNEMINLHENKFEHISSRLSSDDISVSGLKDSQLLVESARCRAYNFKLVDKLSIKKMLSKKILELTDYSKPMMNRTIEYAIALSTDTKTKIVNARKYALVEEEYSKLNAAKVMSSGMASSSFSSLESAGNILKQYRSENENKGPLKTSNSNLEEDIIVKKNDLIENNNQSFNNKQNFDFGQPDPSQSFTKAKNSQPQATSQTNNEYTENFEVSDNDVADNKLNEMSKKLNQTNERLNNEVKKQSSGQKASTTNKDENSDLKSLSNELAEIKEKLASKSGQTKMNEPIVSLPQSPLQNVTENTEVSERNFTANIRSGSTGEGMASGPGVTSIVGASTGTSSISSSDTSMNSQSRSDALSTVAGSTISQAASTNTLPIKIVLSSIDGISQEQKDALIVSNILELKGESFDIIEDGEQVRILPLTEKGKLVLSDGKPRFKKIKSGKKVDEKNSRKITSTGDLKKFQETAVKKEEERFHYLKVKKLADDLIQKKEISSDE